MRPDKDLAEKKLSLHLIGICLRALDPQFSYLGAISKVASAMEEEGDWKPPFWDFLFFLFFPLLIWVLLCSKNSFSRLYIIVALCLPQRRQRTGLKVNAGVGGGTDFLSGDVRPPPTIPLLDSDNGGRHAWRMIWQGHVTTDVLKWGLAGRACWGREGAFIRATGDLSFKPLSTVTSMNLARSSSLHRCISETKSIIRRELRCLWIVHQASWNNFLSDDTVSNPDEWAQLMTFVALEIRLCKMYSSN